MQIGDRYRASDSQVGESGAATILTPLHSTRDMDSPHDSGRMGAGCALSLVHQLLMSGNDNNMEILFCPDFEFP